MPYLGLLTASSARKSLTGTRKKGPIRSTTFSFTPPDNRALEAGALFGPRPKSNNRHHSACDVPIPPIRFEKFRVAIRTKTASANLSLADAISSQLPTRRPNQVPFRSSQELELPRHFGSHFETA